MAPPTAAGTTKFVQPSIFFDSSVSFARNVSFDSSVYFKGTTHISSPEASTENTPYALLIESIDGNVVIKQRQFGTMAWETSTNYTTQAQFDASIQEIVNVNIAQDASIVDLQTKDTNIDTSLNALWSYNDVQDASIAAIGGGWQPYVDGSLAIRDASIVRIDASLNDTIEALDLFYGKAYIDGSLGIRDALIEWLDSNKVNRAGDTMMGTLVFASSGFTLDDVTINTIDTLAEGLGQLDTAIPTSAAVKSAIDAAIASGVSASNGLTELTDGSIGLGGTLSMPTTIVTDAINTFTLDGLQSGATLLSIISDSGVLKTQQLGTMALEASSSYYYASQIDVFITDISTHLGTRVDNVETSIGALDTLTQSHTAQLAVHEASIGILAAEKVFGWNGLTRIDNSIGLGGTLRSPTTITTSSTNTLTLAGLVTSTVDTPYALVKENGGSIKQRQLGTMAWATAANYATLTYVDGSLFTRDANIAQLDASIVRIDGEIAQLDASIVRIDASLNTIYGGAITTASNGLTKTGQNVALGGTLTANTNIDTGAYYLSITGDTRIIGDLAVDGSVTYINAVNLNVSDNIITLNHGETGAGVTKTFAGIAIDRGSLTNYFFGFSELDETFRLGIQSEGALPLNTQAIATREDTPEEFGIPFWNASIFRFDTSSGFEFTPNVGLSLPIATNDPTEATALMINGSGLVVSRELGSNAFTSTEYAVKADVDSSLADVWTKLDNVDSSLNNIWTKLDSVDTSLNNIWTKLDNVDSSIAGLDILTQSHTQSVVDLSTGKLDAIANTTGVSGSATLYSGEENNVAYIKQLVAGTGTTITEDSSTVTITVTGASGYMSKYTGTFDGTFGSSLVINAITHSLGTGPFIVSVFDNNEQVYTGVQSNVEGDITLTWSSGSLTANCRYIISG